MSNINQILILKKNSHVKIIPKSQIKIKDLPNDVINLIYDYIYGDFIVTNYNYIYSDLYVFFYYLIQHK